MKRSLCLLLCLLLLGCRPTAVIPPVDPPTPPPVITKPAELLRAVAVVSGEEHVLYTHSLSRVLAADGEVIFEYSTPVILAPDSQAELIGDGSKVRMPLPSLAKHVSTPKGILDQSGNALPTYTFALERHAFLLNKVTWHSGSVTEELLPGSWSIVLMPGEVVEIEFVGAVDQSAIIALFGERLQGVNHSFEWLDNSTLAFAINDSAAEYAILALEDNESRGWHFVITTPQKLVVIDSNGQVLSTVDVPISSRGAIAMTPDFDHVRLARNIWFGWLSIGLLEYQMDLTYGQISSEPPRSYYRWDEDYVQLDWMNETREVVEQLGIDWSPAGLSHSGETLATYEWEQVKLTSVETQSHKLYHINSHQGSDGNHPDPQWLHWSHDDSRIYYTAYNDPNTYSGTYGVYCLDLNTGEETLLLDHHVLRSVSPYSDHLLTVSRDGTSSGYMADSSGRAVRLSDPTEQVVVVTKWIDASRALINKSTAAGYGSFYTDSKCYIYYLDQNRWEFIREGYGFDYDVATGRIFVLQNR